LSEVSRCYGVSSGVGGSEGGVIGFGDKGDIGFGGDNGDIGFGGVDGVAVVVVVVMFFIDFGRPQTSDSVPLTNLSFGLLGSHIFALSSGDIVVLSELLLGGEGDGGWGTKGSIGDRGDDCSWAWLTLITPISNTALTAPAATKAANTITTELIIVFIFI
jgi:hypothetical protein